MFKRLFKPDGSPVYALLIIILAAIAFFIRRNTRDLAPRVSTIITLIFVSVLAVIAIRFLRGLRFELTVVRDGLTVAAPVTAVEHKTGSYPPNPRYGPREWWEVRFAFADQGGARHESSIDVFSGEDAQAYEADGATVNIKYHPRCPEIFRWMD